MRRAILLVLFIAAVIAAPKAHPQQDDKPMKSALETSKKGWEELPMEPSGWKRVAPAKGKLAAREPWTFNKDETLSYDGTTQEMLLLIKLKTNGIFHAEWRYKIAPAKGAASGGPVVRASVKGDVWHEALAGNKAGGFFVGQSIIDDKPAKVPATNKLPGPTRILEAGEWNVYEITFKEKTLSLFANGYTTAEWLFCDVPKGYIGVKGDGAPIEFRNLKFKRLK